jgi:hypothetical protein
MEGRPLTNSTPERLAWAIMDMNLHLGYDDPMDIVYGLYFPQDGPRPETNEVIGAAKHFMKILCESDVQEHPPPNTGGSRYRRNTRRSKIRKTRTANCQS